MHGGWGAYFFDPTERRIHKTLSPSVAAASASPVAATEGARPYSASKTTYGMGDKPPVRGSTRRAAVLFQRPACLSTLKTAWQRAS